MDMLKAYGVLRRSAAATDWNLLGGYPYTIEAEKPEQLRLARKAQIGWQAVYPSDHIIVSEIDYDRCRAVNNRDGFPNARSV